MLPVTFTKEKALFTSLRQFHLTLNIATKSVTLKYLVQQTENQEWLNLLQYCLTDSNAAKTV
jgi:hypothetical protein